MDTEFDYIVRAKAEQLGVPVGAIFAALATKRVNGEMGEDDPTEVVLLLSKKMCNVGRGHHHESKNNNCDHNSKALGCYE